MINLVNSDQGQSLLCSIIPSSVSEKEVTCSAPSFPNEQSFKIEFKAKGLTAQLCDSCKEFRYVKTSSLSISSLDKEKYSPGDTILITGKDLKAGEVILTNKNTNQIFKTSGQISVDSLTKVQAGIPDDIYHGVYTVDLQDPVFGMGNI